MPEMSVETDLDLRPKITASDIYDRYVEEGLCCLSGVGVGELFEF